MSRTRLSTALIALSATALSLLSPVAAQAAEIDSGCQAQVEEAKGIHEAKIAAGTAGSSLVGPQELLQGLGQGYGSSGMPEVPDCVRQAAEDEEQKEWDEMPDWLQWLRPGGSAAEAISWAGVILGLGAALVQGLVIISKVDPSVLEPVRNALKQLGFQF